MKRLRRITFACLLLSAVLFAASTLLQRQRSDSTLPVIEITQEPLILSVSEHGSDALLAGMTARDEKDGDLTGHILLRDILLQEGSRMKATYFVADSDHHIAVASRTVEYTDYLPPRFSLSAPLTYAPGGTVRIKDRLTASDVIDGDLSDRIRINANNLSPRYDGVYPVTFEVTNSLGDTSSLTLDITVKTPEAGAPVIRLRDYLIYVSENDAFDPMQYLESVSGASKNDVAVKLPVRGLQKGVNTVTYSCVSSGGIRGEAVLYVVAE